MAAVNRSILPPGLAGAPVALLASLLLGVLGACSGDDTASSNVPSCGDGRLQADEACDDGNANGRDGCSPACEVESGFECEGEPSECTRTEGDTSPVDTSVDTGTGDDTGIDDTAPDGSGETDTTPDGSGSDTGVEDVTPDGSGDTSDDTGSDTTADTGSDTTADTGSDTGADTGTDTGTGDPVCGNGVVEAGEPCDDGNNATGDGCTLRCNIEAGWVCTGSPSICIRDLCRGVSCDGLAGACQTAACEPATGECVVTPLANGLACDDGSLCTTSDSCTDGACAGTAVACSDDGGGCSVGVCNPSSGACEYAPLDDCTACPGGFCAGGACGGLPPAVVYGFEQASDAAAFTSTTTPWRIDTAEAHTGAASFRSGDIGASGSTSATIVVDNAAATELRFWVKRSTEACCDDLELRINGTLDATTWAGVVDWTEVVRPLPAGRNTIEFRYTKDGSVDTGADAVWIDEVNVGATAAASCGAGACGDSIFNGEACVVCEPVADGTVCDGDGSDCQVGACQAGACVNAPVTNGSPCATDNECQAGTCNAGACVEAPLPDCTTCAGGTSFCAGGSCGGQTSSYTNGFETAAAAAELTMGGALPWRRVTAQFRSGGASLRSGAITGNQTSTATITRTLAVAGELRFWVRTDSESCCDRLRLTINGTIDGTTWGGNPTWVEVVRPLPAGANTIVFSYSKDGSVDTGADAAWIDDLTIGGVGGSCAGDSCGTALFDGDSCIVCGAEPDGTVCDGDASDCQVGACEAGRCQSAPVPDGSACPGSTECSAAACSAGACVVAPLDDCTLCAGGADVCAGGVCGGVRGVAYGFERAADAAAFTSTTTGRWAIDATTARTGTSSFKSGSTATSADTTATLRVTGTTPQQLRFWLKTSTESCCDKLRLRINGTEDATTWGGETNWTEVVRTLPAGTVTVDFIYRKDASAIAGSDAVWIDDVSVGAAGASACGEGLCGDSVFNGTGCVVCDPVPDGTVCDGDASDCQVGACDRGACRAQNVPDGSDCDGDVTDCTVASCRAGACATANAPDCSFCGTSGTGLCGGGTCQGPDEATVLGFEGGSLSPATSTGSAWTVDATTSNSGTRSAKSASVPSGSSTLTLQVNNPAATPYSFWYRVSSEGGFDYLIFRIDGTEVARWAGEVGWTQRTGTLTPGPHTLTWVYSKDASGNLGSDAAWVDDISIGGGDPCGSDECGRSVSNGGACVTCGDTAPDCTACAGGTDICVAGRCGGVGSDGVDEGFEGPGLPAGFVTAAPAWTLDATNPGAGARSARSGTPAALASSTMTRTVTVGSRATVSFLYRVDSEPTYDLFEFLVDGVVAVSDSGSVAWTPASVNLTAGAHTLVWRYRKDGSTNVGADAAWVDSVVVGDATTCAGDACGDQAWDGTRCAVCPVQPDGASCDTDGTDCLAESCIRGRCIDEGLPDCTACGTAGDGLCLGGLCGGLPNLRLIDFETSLGVDNFFTGGDVPWDYSNERSYSGTWSMAVGPMGNDEFSYFGMVIEAPTAGTVSFWLLRRGTNRDAVHFYIDPPVTLDPADALQTWTGSTSVWTQVTFDVSAGTHELVWDYVAGPSTGTADRKFFIDDIEVTGYPACSPSDSCTFTGFDGVGCASCDLGVCGP